MFNLTNHQGNVNFTSLMYLTVLNSSKLKVLVIPNVGEVRLEELRNGTTSPKNKSKSQNTMYWEFHSHM